VPRGKVKVVNETKYMGNTQTITAKIDGQAQQIAHGSSYTFDVGSGKQDLNVELTQRIQGLGSGHELIPISDDFSNHVCKVSLNQNVWSIQRVAQK
jgi:hypothetical protein